MVINMVVVTKGAGPRVRSFGAASPSTPLPGKQMAIDADLAAGLMTAEEAGRAAAKSRPRPISTARWTVRSKFVKGDAIAGAADPGAQRDRRLLPRHDQPRLSASLAAERYVTLAVGDALVAQVPVAAALDRRRDDRDPRVRQPRPFGPDRRPVLQSRHLARRSPAYLLAIGLIPAMPQTIFLPAAAIAGRCWWKLRQRAQQPHPPVEPVDRARSRADRPRRGQRPHAGHGRSRLRPGPADRRPPRLAAGLRGSPGCASSCARNSASSSRNSASATRSNCRPTITASCSAACRSAARTSAATRSWRSTPATSSARPRTASAKAPAIPASAARRSWIDKAQKDHAIAEGYLAVDSGTVVATHLNQLLSNSSRNNCSGPTRSTTC